MVSNAWLSLEIETINSDDDIIKGIQTGGCVSRLLVCFIRGMDLRRIEEKTTPCINGLLRSFPWVGISTIPTPELTQTIFTGQYPHEHGMWEVELKSDSNVLAKNKIIDKIPDFLTTTFQCLIHVATKSFDLAAIPPWRRRRFEVSRYKNFPRPLADFFKLQNVVSIFDIVGTGKFIHLWTNKYNDMNKLLTYPRSDNLELEWRDLYFLDQLQHWYLDDGVKIRKFYKKVDQFVEKLYQECQKSNVTLMLLSDHGMEPVKGSIDIKSKLEKLKIPSEEYTYFIEAPVARFWFHTETARSKILNMLSSVEQGKVQNYRDLREYKIEFHDTKYGETYFRMDHGYIIFPHDFYHPLANLFLGLTDWQQRSRILNPKHRGYHGYPPNNESEKGFMILLDNHYGVTKKEVEIIDVAPTVLGLLGYEKPDHMRGNCVFTN